MSDSEDGSPHSEAMMSESKTRHWLGILVSAAVTALCSVVLANPSHEDFDAALDVHGGESSVKLQQSAQAQYEEANEALTALAKGANSGRASRLDPKKIGSANLALSRLRRLAEQLRVFAEPAGADYQLRCEALNKSLTGFAEAYKPLPSSQKFIHSVRLQIGRQGPARLKALRRIEQLVAKQDWEPAEKALYDVYDTLAPGTIFLSPGENQEIYGPFANVDMAVQNAMLRMRSQKALELLTATRQEQTPNFAALLADMRAAANALANASTATWAGESLSGPQLVGRFGQTWQETQVAVLRCRTLDWAMAHRGTDMYREGMEPSDGPRKSKIDDDFRQFSDSLVQILTQTIEADAQRASGEEAVRLYAEYLREIAPFARQTHQRFLAQTLEPSLEKLASKSAGFAEEVAAYRAATTEILRWRQRLAVALAASHMSRYVPVEKKFFEATQSDAQYKGLFAERNPNPRTSALLASAPEIMPVACQRLMGQPVTVFDVVRVPGGGSAAIARYRLRNYATTPAPLPLQAEVEALRFDLLAGEQAPPLTLAATQALVTAERGDLVAAGGEITGLYLEGVATRFATLPPGASVLCPLGALPREETDYDFLAQMLMRFDVRPHWAQHDHFFVEFP